MSGGLPAISGPDLCDLLMKDGWQVCARCRHGLTLKKVVNGTLRITTIPTKSRSLSRSVLGQILGPKQTGIGRNKLLELLQS